ncbi:MAG TPA: molybdopterin oxidoreductase, partial [Planctomycetia bacterium]|nr:molybdopterin oxidoreductase [Planctomycetia bacterium]
MKATEPSPYWRSLAELEGASDHEGGPAGADYKAAAAAEFPHGVVDETTDPSRRRFVQLMGASVALASGAGCRWPQEKVLPLTRKPGDAIPGIPKRFATAYDLGGVAAGLLVTSYDGRPIKIEGNEKHPDSLGATDGYAQASLLEMYDPDRLAKIARPNGGGAVQSDWNAFLEATAGAIRKAKQAGGKGFRILAEGSSSPTLARLRAKLMQALPDAKWVEYEPTGEAAELAGAAMAFGKPQRAHYKLEGADVILALDANFLAAGGASVRLAREFSRRRTGAKGTNPNRLYAVEPNYTCTGASADHRLPLRAEQIKPFLLALEAKLGDATPLAF